MKKRNHLVVKRISTSPYFKESFAQLEKETIENKTGAHVLVLNSPTPADVLITNTHTEIEKISPSDIEHCQLMIHPNSGYDNFNAQFVASAPFPIITGNPIRSHAVTNFILSALFSHYSKLEPTFSWDKTRQWPRKLLSELNILILGAGHIGELLFKSLNPLVASLQLHDPYKKLDKLDLENVDVIILACSLNSKNHHMINSQFLNQLKKEDVLLINAARGALVHTHDLLNYLAHHPKAFAFLDVFESEPADFSFFSQVKNIQLSSHIAGVFANIDQETANFNASVIYDFTQMPSDEFKTKYQNTLLQNRLHNDFLL